MDIIETAKKSLRITHNNFDEEIVDMTDAALEDLRAAGIEATATGSALGRQAVILYCKWMYDFMGKGEEYRKAYERLRNSMSTGGVYDLEKDENVKPWS
nr:MAG TPA: tail connector protein [Caudoviricetes sp.]